MMVRKLVPTASRYVARPRLSGSSASGTTTSNVRPTSRPENSRRQNADDREVGAIKTQEPTHHVLSAVEVSPPKPVADHGDRAVSAAAALIVSG